MSAPAEVQVLCTGEHRFDRDWQPAENGRCGLREGMRPDTLLSGWLDENEAPAGKYRLVVEGRVAAEINYPGASAQAGGRCAA